MMPLSLAYIDNMFVSRGLPTHAATLVKHLCDIQKTCFLTILEGSTHTATLTDIMYDQKFGTF
jgi:hypothetical protein